MDIELEQFPDDDGLEDDWGDEELDGEIDAIPGEKESKEPNLYTLDEPIWKTIGRDVLSMVLKMLHVVIPLPAHLIPQQFGGHLKHLNDWDLYGPLFICLSLAIVLSINAEQDQAAIIFTAVFVIMWVGSAIVAFNAILVGGKGSIFQSICVLGYCIAPLTLTAIVTHIVHIFWQNIWFRLGLVVLGLIWFLLSKGADPCSASKRGESCLHMAARHGNFEIGKLLVEARARINASLLEKAGGESPLHVACEFNRANLASYLIGKGADVNIENTQGATPLHKAVFYDSLDTLKLLLEKRAEVNYRDSSRRTPLHWAAFFCRPKIVDCLLNVGGADFYLLDACRETPRDIAKRKAAKDGGAEVLDILTMAETAESEHVDRDDEHQSLRTVPNRPPDVI